EPAGLEDAEFLQRGEDLLIAEAVRDAEEGHHHLEGLAPTHGALRGAVGKVEAAAVPEVVEAVALAAENGGAAGRLEESQGAAGEGPRPGFALGQLQRLAVDEEAKGAVDGEEVPAVFCLDRHVFLHGQAKLQLAKTDLAKGG